MKMPVLWVLFYQERKNGKMKVWDYYETQAEAEENRHFAEEYGRVAVAKYAPSQPRPKRANRIGR